MTWRCSYDDALRPVETPVSSNGPYVIATGALAAVCVHEASHAVMLICTGERIGSIEVVMNFERTYGGAVIALVSGNARRAGVTSNFEASPTGFRCHGLTMPRSIVGAVFIKAQSSRAPVRPAN
jgi:hypothetical protein